MEERDVLAECDALARSVSEYRSELLERGVADAGVSEWLQARRPKSPRSELFLELLRKRSWIGSCVCSILTARLSECESWLPQNWLDVWVPDFGGRLDSPLRFSGSVLIGLGRGGHCKGWLQGECAYEPESCVLTDYSLSFLDRQEAILVLGAAAAPKAAGEFVYRFDWTRSG